MVSRRDETVRFRTYRSGDLRAIFALDEICFAPPFRFSMDAMRRFAEARNALTLIAARTSDAGEEIVGFCIVHVEQARAALRAGYVVTLDVAPEMRRLGLARRMMQSLEMQACDAGCDEMVLHVSVENAGAMRFYESAGYARSHVARSFYGTGRDAFVYRRMLTEPPIASEDAR